MSRRRESEEPIVKVNLFLFYIKDGVQMVNVDTSLAGDIWRNQFCHDKSLHQTMNWCLNGFNNHTRMVYYQIPDQIEEEYVFFVNVGNHDGAMPGVQTDARATLEEFWNRAQHCFADKFSLSASWRMSIGQALGAFEQLYLPPFISQCPVVPNLEAAEVRHNITLHAYRSPRA